MYVLYTQNHLMSSLFFVKHCNREQETINRHFSHLGWAIETNFRIVSFDNHSHRIVLVDVVSFQYLLALEEFSVPPTTNFRHVHFTHNAFLGCVFEHILLRFLSLCMYYTPKTI